MPCWLYKHTVLFDVFPVRRRGVLLPRFVFWSGGVRGALHVIEEHDTEVHRLVRIATIRDGETVLLGPLLDAVLVSAKPDWWTMTGWERLPDDVGGRPCAFQQSWVLVPAASEDAHRARGEAAHRRAVEAAGKS